MATIHLMDSKRLILNLLVAPAAFLMEQIMTKAPLACLASQRSSVPSWVV
ncbi:hypothetical protein [Bradyrhizobium sp. AZCC 1721]